MSLSVCLLCWQNCYVCVILTVCICDAVWFDSAARGRVHGTHERGAISTSTRRQSQLNDSSWRDVTSPCSACQSDRHSTHSASQWSSRRRQSQGEMCSKCNYSSSSLCNSAYNVGLDDTSSMFLLYVSLYLNNSFSC